MNGNITKVNENLYIVNFQYVKDEFIQELKFMDDNADDVVKISTDGRMLLNAVYIQKMSSVIPVIVAVMNLDDKDLHSKKGFCTMVKTIIPKTEMLPDSKIMHYIWKENPDMWTTYRNICNWETTRRQAKKDFIRKHPFLSFKNKILERG